MGNTQYLFTMSLGTDSSNEGATMVFTNASGMTDELALALARAITDVPWPAQSGAWFQVSKLVTDQTRTEGDSANGAFV